MPRTTSQHAEHNQEKYNAQKPRKQRCPAALHTVRATLLSSLLRPQDDNFLGRFKPVLRVDLTRGEKKVLRAKLWTALLDAAYPSSNRASPPAAAALRAKPFRENPEG